MTEKSMKRMPGVVSGSSTYRPKKDRKPVVAPGSLDQFRQAGKGLKQLRELTKSSRSQSKR